MLTLSPRLMTAASFVYKGARVCDIGADHGYLAVYLIQSGIAQSVTAADIRKEPLQRGIENAKCHGADKSIEFVLSDGLDMLDVDRFDTVIICGMGGDAIAEIISRAVSLRNEKYSLILQPMSSADNLRRFLFENGFTITDETLVSDTGRLYSVMRAEYTGTAIMPEPWMYYLSPALRSSAGPLLPEYLNRLIKALKEAADGTAKSGKPHDAPRNASFREAVRGLEEIRNADS